MTRRLVFVLLLAVVCYAFFAVGQATAFSKDPKLSLLASLFAQRSVTVRCYEPDEPGSPSGYGAWGYVRKPIGRAKYAAIDGELCAAALDLNDSENPPYLRALSVVVIVHESYHLRHWGGSGDEGKVECKAIRHWKVAARMLGASDDTIADLWPIALAAHYEQTRIFDWRTGDRPYDDPKCEVPRLESL